MGTGSISQQIPLLLPINIEIFWILLGIFTIKVAHWSSVLDVGLKAPDAQCYVLGGHAIFCLVMVQPSKQEKRPGML